MEIKNYKSRMAHGRTGQNGVAGNAALTHTSHLGLTDKRALLVV